MKLLATSRDIAANVERLLSLCQRCWIAVAWASIDFNAFHLLIKHKPKIVKMVVGTEFFQTHPDFVKAFLFERAVKFVLKTATMFHPKAYLFELADGHFECVVGSANFTKGGFEKNAEVAVLFTESDSGAASVRDQLMTTIEKYWSEATVLTEQECEAYFDAWRQKQPVLNRLQGRFGNPTKLKDDHGKPSLEIPILQLPWNNFLAQVKAERMTADGHTAEKRVDMIEAVQQLLRSHSHFHDLNRMDRQKIAGTCERRDEIDYGYFGSMIGAGRFKNVVNENPQIISAALIAIPESGTVTRDNYLLFLQEYQRGFPDGGDGVATASRLLAMKRPDIFVCLDKFNRTKLCNAFQVSSSKVKDDFESYWDLIIERVMEARWWKSAQPLSNADRIERSVWAARSAFLDSLYYDPARTEIAE